MMSVIGISEILFLSVIFVKGALAGKDGGFCEDLMGKWNVYNCDEFEVITQDGFILALQRIYVQEVRRGSLLLLHPTLVSGDMWLHEWPNKPYEQHYLPLILANKGFEVWIANSRCSLWSRRHKLYTQADREFWMWSWDDIAKFDLPAIVVEALSNTLSTSKTLHFVGFSVGATVGVAASTLGLPFTSLTLIGPTAYLGQVNSTALTLWGRLSGPLIDNALVSIGFQSGAFNFTTEEIPAFDTSLDVGRGFMQEAFGPSCCVPEAALSNFSFGSTGWDGVTSYRNLMHLQQGIQSNRFQAYDYGTIQDNMAQYGTPYPLPYNLSAIDSKVPILVVHGGQDHLSSPNNVQSLLDSFPTSLNVSRLYLPSYGLLDFIFSETAEVDLFEKISSFILEVENLKGIKTPRRRLPPPLNQLAPPQMK